MARKQRETEKGLEQYSPQGHAHRDPLPPAKTCHLKFLLLPCVDLNGDSVRIVHIQALDVGRRQDS